MSMGMSDRLLLLALAPCLIAVSAPIPLSGQPLGLPLRDGRPVVAVVNDDTISLDELVMELDPPVDLKRLAAGRATTSELQTLDRMITVRLVVQEAAAMGLGELPEIRKQVDVTSRQILRDVLMERAVKGVRLDEAAVEAAARELVKEWKTVSLLFKDEAAARALRDAVAKGAAYDDVAARAVADGTARAEGDTGYHKRKDYLPAIADVVERLDVGQVSPVIRLDAGFVLVKVVDIRYPEVAQARAEARRAVLARQQEAALKAYEEALRAQYVVIHEDVLEKLDYAAPTPGFEALLKDPRILAEIKGAAPITVGDLTDYLRLQFFHGSDRPGHGARMNARKRAAFEATLGRRLLNHEALRLGLDHMHAYVDRVNAFEDGLVFDAFVQKVVAPGSKMRDAEVKAYYDAHRAEYVYPSMLKVRSLAFTTRAAAEAATETLRAGTDFGWLAATASAQVDKGAAGLLVLDGRLVTLASVPEGMRKVLGDAHAGEVRLYASPEGHFYVLAVQDVVAPTPRPYDEVREDIARTLYAEKLQKGIEEYATRLRALSRVEVYVKRTQ